MARSKVITASVQGGEALQRHLNHIALQLGSGAGVRVGFLADATYPADAAKKGAPLHVAQVAFWDEFGTSRAPMRPFIRNMIASKSPRWGYALGQQLRATDYDSEAALARMGEGIKDQMVKSIVDFKDPPNAAYTIAKKGFNKPLIDTGVMQRSVDYQVVTGTDGGDDA